MKPSFWGVSKSKMFQNKTKLKPFTAKPFWHDFRYMAANSKKNAGFPAKIKEKKWLIKKNPKIKNRPTQNVQNLKKMF